MRLKHTISCLILCFLVLELNAEEFSLSMMINTLKDSISFTRTEALSQIGIYDYKSAKASLYPSIDGSVPFSVNSSKDNNYLQGIISQEDQIFTAAPNLSLSQLLPTAGVLTAQLTNSVSLYKLLASNPAGLTDPVVSNSIDLSLNLAQPVFYKGAFNAVQSLINKTYENSKLSVLASRNSIILNAVENYYNLKQAIFNLELIQIRFENDKENFKKINQEFEMGLWTISDLYQARSILVKSETDLLEAEQTRDAIRQFMISNYSLSDNKLITPIVEPIDLDVIDYKNVINNVVANNPEVLQVRNARDMQKASIIVLKKDDGPQLTLGGSYSYLMANDNLDSNKSTLSFSLGISGNLFDGGKDNAAMKSEKALLKKLESDFGIGILNLEQQTKSIYDALSRSAKLNDLYNLQEEAALYEYEKGRKDLALGQITKKDLSELQIELENTKLRKQQNIINTNLYYLQLADLQGTDLIQHPIFRNNI
jgi:outer membrane protein TolC